MILSPGILAREVERARRKLRISLAFENASVSRKGLSDTIGMTNPMSTGVRVLIPIDGNPNQIIFLGEI